MRDCRFSICLTLGVMCLLALDSHAITISSATELINLFNESKENVVETEIEVLNDLDFSSANLTYPLGVKEDGTCVAYRGVFHGNGKSIKGLRMGLSENAKFENVGLFCNLQNATIKDITIDYSCAFIGSNGGALSVIASGPLNVTNVRNEAAIRGSSRVGGLIGSIEHVTQKDALFSFDRCMNTGAITGDDWYVGGFVGYIFSNKGIEVRVQDCTNNGAVKGNSGGGFIGGFGNNEDTSVIISSSTNKGYVDGLSNEAGGFSGTLSGNSNLMMTISKCVNTGTIIGDQYGSGGMIGSVSGPSSSATTSLTIVNCANHGTVSSNGELACGLFCTNERGESNYMTTVLNSINKGKISSQNFAFGITNIVTNARNVVSLGDVNGQAGGYTFWKESDFSLLFYSLNINSVNCTGESLIMYNDITEMYDTVWNDEHAHDLLNEDAVNQNYGMFWTTGLDLADKVMVTVTLEGAIDETITVELGSPLSSILILRPFWTEQYEIIDTWTRMTYTMVLFIYREMSIEVIKKHYVTVGNPVNKGIYVFPSETVEGLLRKHYIETNKFIVVNQTTWDILPLSQVLSDGDVLSLCHKVTFHNGTEKVSFIVEHGKSLMEVEDIVSFTMGYHLLEGDNPKTLREFSLVDTAETDLDLKLFFYAKLQNPINVLFVVLSGENLCSSDLSFYLNPANYYQVIDSTDSHHYSCDDFISSDVEMFVNDLCLTFVMDECKRTNGTCTWHNENQTCSRIKLDQNDTNVGAVIGICVGAAVILICFAFFAGVMIRRNLKNVQQLDRSESDTETN